MNFMRKYTRIIAESAKICTTFAILLFALNYNPVNNICVSGAEAIVTIEKSVVETEPFTEIEQPSFEPKYLEEAVDVVEVIDESIEETQTEEKDPNEKLNSILFSKEKDANRYIGRFEIPSIGINVACYDSYAQATVDAFDSAACFYCDGHINIADHVDQTFWSLKSCSVGAKAYFTINEEVESYTCIDVIHGHNTGIELTDANYNNLSHLYPDAIVCYTCNGGWQNIIVVFFMPDNALASLE